jgi:hypothetical protein
MSSSCCCSRSSRTIYSPVTDRWHVAVLCDSFRPVAPCHGCPPSSQHVGRWATSLLFVQGASPRGGVMGNRGGRRQLPTTVAGLLWPAAPGRVCDLGPSRRPLCGRGCLPGAGAGMRSDWQPAPVLSSVGLTSERWIANGAVTTSVSAGSLDWDNDLLWPSSRPGSSRCPGREPVVPMCCDCGSGDRSPMSGRATDLLT